MVSDYKAISRYNEEQLGKDTASRKSQVNMYSDPTHFVYEILQNADDYKANKVSFQLLPDKLIIEHNGIPFNTKNVEAISYFGKGTSEEDLVKTGHFGLGFKSVFAFTASPIIHSGDEHFEIFDLYRLRAVTTHSDLPENCTRIILPFNHINLRPDYIENYISPETAFNEISKRLKELNKISLLFTQHIREIKWVAVDEKGHYLRDEAPTENETYSPVFRKRKTTITDGESTQTYLVFSRRIQWYDSSTEKENQYKPVDIAFRLDDEGKSISKKKHPLVVLFKTKIETHMGFLLNGPYRTTPNRETINIGDEFNEHLVAETATLLAETLPQLRDMGFMDINLLTTLPIVDDDFSEENEDNLFLPIYEKVKVELCENSLLPTDDGNFVSAKQAKFADGEGLRKLISEDHLKALLNVEEPLKWLSKEITYDKTRDLWSYLRYELNVEEVSPMKFARMITSQFLEEQTDEWMVQLYIYFDSVWNTVDTIAKNKPFIRLKNNQHVSPFQDDGTPNAYLPGYGDSNYPLVKKTIADNEEALEFLKRLHIKEVGEKEGIQTILASYYRNSEVSTKQTSAEHMKHMKRFINWSQKGGTLTIFDDYKIFRDNIYPEQQYFWRANRCFIDLPFKNTGLSALYDYSESEIQDDVPMVPLWEQYKELESFIDFAISVGVKDKLEINEIDTWNNPDKAELHKDYYSTKISKYEIDEDYSIDGLDELLACKNINVSKLIWNTMRNIDPKVLIARYRPNQQYPIREAPSFIVACLMNKKWIPNLSGEFCEPAKMTKDQLPNGFIHDEESDWLKAIDFGINIEKQTEAYIQTEELSEKLGVSVEFVDAGRDLSPANREKLVAMAKRLKEEELREDGDSNQDNLVYREEILDSFIKPQVIRPKKDSDAPGEVLSPEIRHQQVEEQIQTDISNNNIEYIIKPMKIWNKKNEETRIFLREEYKGRCQICGDVFQKRDAEPYFEGLYLVSRTRASWIDRPGNVLCLCPTCCAKFQHGSVEAEDIVEQIEALQPRKEERGKTSIALKLCGKECQIDFSDRHLIDLQELLKSSSKNKSS